MVQGAQARAEASAPKTTRRVRARLTLPLPACRQAEIAWYVVGASAGISLVVSLVVAIVMKPKAVAAKGSAV